MRVWRYGLAEDGRRAGRGAANKGGQSVKCGRVGDAGGCTVYGQRLGLAMQKRIFGEPRSGGATRRFLLYNKLLLLRLAMCDYYCAFVTDILLLLILLLLLHCYCCYYYYYHYCYSD